MDDFACSVALASQPSAEHQEKLETVPGDAAAADKSADFGSSQPDAPESGTQIADQQSASMAMTATVKRQKTKRNKKKRLRPKRRNC